MSAKSALDAFTTARDSAHGVPGGGCRPSSRRGGGRRRGAVRGRLADGSPRRGPTPLYCYRALTGQFIGEREAALKRLPGHAEAAKLLERFEGLDRYLASVGSDGARAKGRARVRVAIKALMDDVFEEQTDFELRPERLQAALDRLQQSEIANPSEVTLVATLHG